MNARWSRSVAEPSMRAQSRGYGGPPRPAAQRGGGRHTNLGDLCTGRRRSRSGSAPPVRDVPVRQHLPGLIDHRHLGSLAVHVDPNVDRHRRASFPSSNCHPEHRYRVEQKGGPGLMPGPIGSVLGGDPMALGDEIELRVGELPARGDAELAEYFPEVVVDGVGAEVELGGDLRVGRACGG